MAMPPPKLSPYSEGNLATLKTAFPGEGLALIEETAHRAISLTDLQRIWDFVVAESSKWYDAAPKEISATSGQALSPDSLNLYHFNTWAIMPATKERNCAFVELMAGREQVPRWFTSHWWGEAIKYFVACVAEHVFLRGLSPASDFYWVCAYANRQHSLSQELVSDPKQTSFYKALKRVDGVLLILDPEATAFSRIWCGFEESSAIQDEAGDLLLDISTFHDNKVSIITEGFCEADCIMQEDPFGGIFGRPGERVHDMALRWFAPWNKSQRQKDFPCKILKKGIKYSVQSGSASVETDRIHILNSIAGRGLDLPPLEEHENYEKVNRGLSSRFVLAAFRHMVEHRLPGMWELPQILAVDDTLKSIVLDFKDVKHIDDSIVRAIAQGLPAGLEILDVAFLPMPKIKAGYGGLITDAGVTDFSRCLPQGLVKLMVDFSSNDLITDEGLISLVKRIPHSVRELYLRFNCCKNLTDASLIAVAEHLGDKLEALELGFTCCNSITDRGLSAIGSKLPSTMRDLMLNMNSCSGLSNEGVRAVMHGVPSGLQELKMFFMFNPRMTDAAMKAIAEKLPPNLEVLGLFFNVGSKVGDQGLIALAQALPASLKTLKVACRLWPWMGSGGFDSIDDFHAWAKRKTSAACCHRVKRCLLVPFTICNAVAVWLMLFLVMLMWNRTQSKGKKFGEKNRPAIQSEAALNQDKFNSVVDIAKDAKSDGGLIPSSDIKDEADAQTDLLPLPGAVEP
eukprot:TRINITY_DN31009_c0_g1_i1.p1 TRINITY_DN31009_c0_g1~~TRINITY_DN31009_c0_g1_i1.p1  ORF type:complete len:755 (-),score=103.78 TRINITY_DN31009_c0_g1_i1:465-2681(-)